MSAKGYVPLVSKSTQGPSGTTIIVGVGCGTSLIGVNVGVAGTGGVPDSPPPHEQQASFGVMLEVELNLSPHSLHLNVSFYQSQPSP